jgi:hypothetical protein
MARDVHHGGCLGHCQGGIVAVVETGSVVPIICGIILGIQGGIQNDASIVYEVGADWNAIEGVESSIGIRIEWYFEQIEVVNKQILGVFYTSVQFRSASVDVGGGGLMRAILIVLGIYMAPRAPGVPAAC